MDPEKDEVRVGFVVDGEDVKNVADAEENGNDAIDEKVANRLTPVILTALYSDSLNSCATKFVLVSTTETLRQAIV